jgi:hypothetical protein
MAHVATRFASGRRAKFACPRCGEVVRYEAKAYEWHTQTWVCRACVDDLPVDRKPIVFTVDAETLRDPRAPNEREITVARIDNASFSMRLWAGSVAGIATSYGDVTGTSAIVAAGTLTTATISHADLTGATLASAAGSPIGAAGAIIAGLSMASAAGTLTVEASSVADLTSAAVVSSVGGPIAAGAADVSGAAMATAAGTLTAEATDYGMGEWSVGAWGI